MIGRVIKGIGGFYYVYDDGKTVMGKARGNLKRNRDLIFIGDIVEYEIDENDGDNQCIINRVTERRNFLSRPPVSNLDMLVAVFSLTDPDVNFPVIDKLLAGCERNDIRPVVCISKTDLVSEEAVERVTELYKDVYTTLAVNGITGEGIDELASIIKGSSVALAGSSGVGKSTVTNWLMSHTDARAETGSVSSKTGRGRHTTRHVEIFPLNDDTYLYDTPGFTSIELQDVEPEMVRDLFPEFRALQWGCRYSDCKHVNEPYCAVKGAVEDGRIDRSRYNSYLIMIDEAIKWQRKQ